jgi:WD40 repeat protein
VIVWDLRTGQQHTDLAGHTQPVQAVACTHLEDGTPIAVTGAGGYGVGGGGEVIVWDLRTGQQRTPLAGHTRPVNAVACTHLEDGTPIAVTGGLTDYSGIGAGGVIVWDLRTGQRHTTALAGHTRPVVNAVACTHLEDGTPIAVTGAGDIGGAGEVIVWDLRTGRMQQTLAAPYPVGALCCDSVGGVVIGTATEIVRLQYERSGGPSGPAQAPGHPQK